MGCQACGSTGVALAFGVAPAPGGAVYATGQVSDQGGVQSMRLLRLTQAGNPDPGFGTGSPAPGVVATPSGIRGVSVAVDASACPVIVGYGMRSDLTNVQIVAARFTSAGVLDQAFNPTGATPGTAAFPLGSRALGETVALQADGSIVIGGEVDQFGNTTTRNAVALRLQGGGCGTKQPPPPTVATGQATNVSSNAATLNGTVNPNGFAVTGCHFEYGTSANTYGASVPCLQSPGTGTSSVPVSAPISGLNPNTTYDYRLVATGSGVTVYGNNQTLTTAAALTTLSTTQVWGMTRGASITVPGSASGEHDEAQLSGADAGSASGSFTFRLYRKAPSGLQCAGVPVFTSTVGLLPVEAGGTSSDPVPTQLAPGTYYWTVAYTGDSANQPTTSACGSEALTVARFWISPNGAFLSAQSLTLEMSCTVPLCTVRFTITTLAISLRASDARLKVTSKPRVITLARGKITIRKRSLRRVRLRLTAAGRKFVASRKGRVTVTVAVATTIHGHTSVLKQRLTIKITKTRKHSHG
jgi:hypothetical protein